MYDVIIGIDIGLSGGIAFFDYESKEVLTICEMPSVKVQTSTGRNKGELNLERLKFILEIPREHKEKAIVVIENVHAFPGQGVVAIATLLEQKGIIRGMCKGLGYDEFLVEPKTWQKYYELVPPKDLKGSTGSKTKQLRKAWLKDGSLELARSKFPEWAETKLAPKTSHGLSDALLIGKWYIDNVPQE